MLFRRLIVPFLGLTVSAVPILEHASSTNSLVDRAVTVTAADVSDFKYYIQYAAAAYCNGQNQPGTLVNCSGNGCPDVQASGAKTVASFSGLATGIRGLVAVDPARSLIVVTVRGSSNLRNWLTNILFAQVPCDLVAGCAVHDGFFNAWLEIKTPLMAAVAAAKLANPSYRIIATGHSLGGAVSTIAAAYLRQDGYLTDIYSYGSPRVGNDALVSFITAQAGGEYRVTHLDDPVPRLPPIFLGYRHTSPEYWLYTGTTNTTNYGVADIKVCEGNANVKCNAGTLELNGAAHNYYFQAVAACQGPFELRRREDISDEELVERLNRYAALDREYAAALEDAS